MESTFSQDLQQRIEVCPIHTWSTGAGQIIESAIEHTSQPLTPRALEYLHELICLRGTDKRLVSFTAHIGDFSKRITLLQQQFADIPAAEVQLANTVYQQVIAEWRIANSPVHRWASAQSSDVIGEVLKTHKVPDGYRGLFDQLLFLRGNISPSLRYHNGRTLTTEMAAFQARFFATYPAMFTALNAALNDIMARFYLSRPST